MRGRAPISTTFDSNSIDTFAACLAIITGVFLSTYTKNTAVSPHFVVLAQANIVMAVLMKRLCRRVGP